MANPFPGMDPYLEGRLWTVVHSNLAEQIARQLVPQVRPKYLVHTNERVVLTPPDPIEVKAPARLPDVGILRAGTGSRPAGGAAVASPLVLRGRVPVATPQKTVEVRRADDQKLVTAIEILSPTNKRGPGRAEYAKKRRQLLARRVHFIEIDLLRVGHRFPLLDPLPDEPYFAFVSRARRRSRVEVWPIAMDATLPTVSVPLLRGDPDAALDLQAALTTIHDLFEYDRSVNYRLPPTVPFTPEQGAWADALLRAAGRRP